MKTTPVGLAVLIAGCVITIVGLGAYQAWWTVVFAIGGFVVFVLDERHVTPGRSIAVGSTISASLLLAGIGVFLLYGSGWGGGMPWLAASIASIAVSIVLAFLARRLLRQGSRM